MAVGPQAQSRPVARPPSDRGGRRSECPHDFRRLSDDRVPNQRPDSRNRNELRKYERKQYADRLVGRGIEKLGPRMPRSRARPFTPSLPARRPKSHSRPRRIASGPRLMTPWPPTDWRLTTARKQSACVASTWLAAGGRHARSTRCSSCAAPRNWRTVRRPFCSISCPLQVTRSNRAQRQMRRTKPRMTKTRKMNPLRPERMR